MKKQVLIAGGILLVSIFCTIGILVLNKDGVEYSNDIEYRLTKDNELDISQFLLNEGFGDKYTYSLNNVHDNIAFVHVDKSSIYLQLNLENNDITYSDAELTPIYWGDVIDDEFGTKIAAYLNSNNDMTSYIVEDFIDDNEVLLRNPITDQAVSINKDKVLN